LFVELWLNNPDVQTTQDTDAEWVRNHYLLPDIYAPDPSRLSPWVLRLTLDRQRLWEQSLGMAKLSDALSNTFSGILHCVYTDDNAPELVLRTRIVNREDPENDDDETDYQFFCNNEDRFLDTVLLSGVPDVTESFLSKKAGGEYIIETSGINMMETLCIPGVDATRTICNNPAQVLDTLGIEAARTVLFNEIKMVIEFDGSWINPRHLNVLCDLMTSRGILMSITRHGINRSQVGPLAKASFEETTDIFLEAAATNEVDDCRGATANIMLGQLAKVGTGCFDLLIEAQDGAPQAVPKNNNLVAHLKSLVT
ncbi:DNA-directed RNA polymerase II subunit rpb1, partial [Quaeritorhiza haematococci]